MKTLLALAMLFASAAADAACVCRCMNGENQPLCSSSLDVQPICPPRACPVEPASIAPIQRPTVPPIGTTDCRQQQVLNPYTGRYEWRTICR